MLHDKDKHTSKCCPFLACCVLQFFLLTIYKPLLYNIDELQKWWSRSLISVQCTRAVYLLMRYRVISVKCINVCAGQINIWHPISLYTGIPVPLCRAAPAHRAVQLPSSFINPSSMSCPEKKKDTNKKMSTWMRLATESLSWNQMPPWKRMPPWGTQPTTELPRASSLLPPAQQVLCWDKGRSQTLAAKGKCRLEFVSSWVRSMLFWHWSFIFTFYISLFFLITMDSTCKSFLFVRKETRLSSNGRQPVALFWCRFKNFFFINLTAFVLLCIFPAAVIAECLLYTL